MRKLFQNFIKCGILGWCLEISFTALNALRRRDYTLRGVTSLWMFPIYGAGCLLTPLLPNMCPEACSGKRISVPGTMKRPAGT